MGSSGSGATTGQSQAFIPPELLGLLGTQNKIAKKALGEIDKGPDPFEIIGFQLGIEGLQRLNDIAENGFEPTEADLERIERAFGAARERVAIDLGLDFEDSAQFLKQSILGTGVAESSIFSGALSDSVVRRQKIAEGAFTSLAGNQATAELQSGRDIANFILQQTGQVAQIGQGAKQQRFGLLTGSLSALSTIPGATASIIGAGVSAGNANLAAATARRGQTLGLIGEIGSAALS